MLSPFCPLPGFSLITHKGYYCFDLAKMDPSPSSGPSISVSTPPSCVGSLEHGIMLSILGHTVATPTELRKCKSVRLSSAS
jgi:hypothetical protein